MAAHGALRPARLDPRAVANCPTPDSHYGTRHGRVGGTGSSNRVRAVRSALLDDLVGAREQRLRHRQAERLRGLQVDHQLEFGRLLDRQIGRLGSG